MSMNLGEDGCVENLFHLLWTKEIIFKNLAQISIPDTIIFKYQQPSFWYFTSKNGEILWKSKKKLSMQAIEQAFLWDVSESGIVAYYIYRKSKLATENGDKGATFKINDEFWEVDEEEKFDFRNFIIKQMKKPESPKFGKDEEKQPDSNEQT